MTSAHGNQPVSRRVAAMLWLALVLFIVYGSTIPFHFTFDHAFVLAKLHGIRLNPLISPDTGRRLSIPDVVQNVVLYVPFGILGMFTVRTLRRPWGTCIAIVVALGVLLSVAIETVQLFTTDRTTSLGDVLANTLGVLCGVMAAPSVTHLGQRLAVRPAIARAVRTPRFYLFAIATLLVCAAAWVPFDVALDVGSAWSKLKALGNEPFEMPTIDTQFALYLLLAASAVSWFQQIGIPSAAFVATAVAVALAFGLEATKLLVESRIPSVKGATMHATGGVVGALISSITMRLRSTAL